jgi:molybdopterin-containing oxidoreductase family iron-sulfur binding subunit
MENSRRSFLKIAGISALGLGAKPIFNALAASEGREGKPTIETARNENALTAKQWAMVIDTRKFESAEDLEPIIEACHKIHNVPDFMDQGNPKFKDANKRHVIKWIWEEEYKHAFPTKENRFLNDRLKDLPFLVLCNHCETRLV